MLCVLLSDRLTGILAIFKEGCRELFFSYTVSTEISRMLKYIWFVGPLRQYFSLYRAVSQLEGERKER